MNVVPTPLPDVKLVEPRVFGDERGLFFESWNARAFAAAGIDATFVQDNHSRSTRGVLRGLHFAQLPPGQAKYVTCLRGAVFDVVVDIRVGSPTYGQWDSVLLDTRERRSVYLEAGLAHGFLALQDDSTVMYLCSAGYDPQREHTVCATDPAIGIDWPTVGTGPRLSDRDAAAPTLAEVRAAGLLPAWEGR